MRPNGQTPLDHLVRRRKCDQMGGENGIGGDSIESIATKRAGINEAKR